MTETAIKANYQMLEWRKKLNSATLGHKPNVYFGNVNTFCEQINIWQEVLWREVMAKKQTETTKVEFKGFANLEVPQDLKDAVKAYLRDNVKVAEFIEVLVLDGHKVTITQNEKNGSYQASAFCTYSKSPNAGYILTAFAGNWYDAMGVLAWKHCVLAGRGKWKDDLEASEMPEFG